MENVTFSKEALVSWDYDGIDYDRYNNTPKDLQKKILEKWYPINNTFHWYTPFNNKKSGRGTKVVIVEHVETYNSWLVVFKYTHVLSSPLISNKINPLRFKPSKELLRNIKLDELL
jgi:hypothetical protein